MKIFKAGTIGSTKNPLSLIKMADKADTGQCATATDYRTAWTKRFIQQEMECDGRSALST